VSGINAIENARLAGIDARSCDVEQETLPIPSDSADCVFFGDVIEHLVHSPKPVLSEIFRVLKPGGFCVATTPNAVRLTVRLKVLLGRSNWADIDGYFDLEYHASHHHEYTAHEFRTVFSRTGFRVEKFTLFEENLRSVKIEGMGDIRTHARFRHGDIVEPPLVSVGKKLLLLITHAWPNLRGGMLLVARK
jgi:SAM-dependent methyltransferase